MVAETLGHRLGDRARKLAIFRIRKIEMLPIAVFRHSPFFADAQRFRIILREPCRRTCCRRREHDVDVVLGRCGYRHDPASPDRIALRLGSMRLHANSPMRITRTPACCISARSASQRDSGHCSGYHDVPSRIAGGGGGAEGAADFAARTGRTRRKSYHSRSTAQPKSLTTQTLLATHPRIIRFLRHRLMINDP